MSPVSAKRKSFAAWIPTVRRRLRKAIAAKHRGAERLTLPTVFDLLRPPVVELRAAPGYFTLPRLDGRCAGRNPAEDDDDPPRMRRLLATSATSTSSADRLLFASSGSAQDRARYAVISGQPYALDIQLFDGESQVIVERIKLDWDLMLPSESPRLIGPDDRSWTSTSTGGTLLKQHRDRNTQLPPRWTMK